MLCRLKPKIVHVTSLPYFRSLTLSLSHSSLIYFYQIGYMFRIIALEGLEKVWRAGSYEKSSSAMHGQIEIGLTQRKDLVGLYIYQDRITFTEG